MSDIEDDIFDDEEIDMDDDDEDDEDEGDDAEPEEGEKDDDDEEELERENAAEHYKVKIIQKDKRRTSNYLSLFEFVNIIGTRAQMIENGDEIYISIENKETSMEIAEAELRAGRCPMMIERRLCTKGDVVYVEMWKASEMVLPPIS